MPLPDELVYLHGRIYDGHTSGLSEIQADLYWAGLREESFSPEVLGAATDRKPSDVTNFMRILYPEQDVISAIQLVDRVLDNVTDNSFTANSVNSGLRRMRAIRLFGKASQDAEYLSIDDAFSRIDERYIDTIVAFSKYGDRTRVARALGLLPHEVATSLQAIYRKTGLKGSDNRSKIIAAYLAARRQDRIPQVLSSQEQPK